MQRLILDEDIKPMSEFRAHTVSCIQQVQNSKRPVVITQHCKSATVLIDVSEFESMIDAGKGISHSKAREMVLKRIAR